MNKKEYFAESERLNLKYKSCPCINKCARHKYTALLLGKLYYKPIKSDDKEQMIEMGILEENESFEKLLYSGSEVEIVGNKNSYYFKNVCPEFNLFDNQHKPKEIPDLAICSGSYDKERVNKPMFENLAFKHFSECNEFSKFKEKGKLLKGKERKSIPQKTKALLQKEIKSQCPFCQNEEVAHFEIHHIDENPLNNDIKNLIMVCKICHSKITKKEKSKHEVNEIKDKLYRKILKNIELIDIKIQSKKCSWVEKAKNKYFIEYESKKNFNPIIKFELLNSSNKSLILKSIEIKTEFLFSGFEGIPLSYILEPITKLKIELKKENRMDLENPLVIPPYQPTSFEIEFYFRGKKPNEFEKIKNRCILDIDLNFHNDNFKLPQIYLNTMNKNKGIPLKLLT